MASGQHGTHGQMPDGTTTSERTANHHGHRIRIETTYRISIASGTTTTS